MPVEQWIQNKQCEHIKLSSGVPNFWGFVGYSGVTEERG